MIKYVDTAITFSEIPDEICLCINLSRCQFNCPGCHSSYLGEDIGMVLTPDELRKLISKHDGITCVCFMGGDCDQISVDFLGTLVHKETNLKNAWYSGSKYFIEGGTANWDYYKIGPYIAELGPLTSKTTNQKLYCKKYTLGEHPDDITLYDDITYKLWK